MGGEGSGIVLRGMAHESELTQFYNYSFSRMLLGSVAAERRQEKWDLHLQLVLSPGLGYTTSSTLISHPVTDSLL